MYMETEYNSIKFDFENKTFQILNGTKGTFSLNHIERCAVLNEKANKIVFKN